MRTPGTETEDSEIIVTIDGPAGSGKSTAARQLAVRLGFDFLDTGAMYRAVAWQCLNSQIDLQSEDDVAGCARDLKISIGDGKVIANGEDVSAAIRTPEVTEVASKVAINTRVRDAMVRLQQNAAKGQNMVTEGRDQGTIVFPDAICKFFLTADVEQRALRRQQELEQQGQNISLEEIRSQIAERDQRDIERDVAPLLPAEDATLVDTSQMSADEVVDHLEKTVKQRCGRDID